MNGLWGQGLMSLAKVIVVLDQGRQRARSQGGVVGALITSTLSAT